MSMSISQILQPPNEIIKEHNLNSKVKIFYTLQGSDTQCLCSFDLTLPAKESQKWVNISLKRCLKSVCSSSPDQFLDNHTAIYSANFEESNLVENWSPIHDSKSNIIWEGHGILSNILCDERNQPQVTGKIIATESAKYDCCIEVLLQLHPIRQQSTAKYLPPMKSIWSNQPLPTYTNYPPALNSNYPPSRYDPNSFENKRRKLSPPIIYDHMPQKKDTYKQDPYFHQSRRKKRDTKPPNANDIRPFVEIQRRSDGTYILPAEVDSWTVLDLGKVIWDKAAFHNQRYIYPVGYRVKKWYRSMVDPHNDTQYTCEILDGGDEPIFQLKSDDNPNECWRGPTPTTVWTIAVRRAFAIRNMDYGHNPVGPDFFGLRKNTIAKMIQDLPGADKCKNYIWQNFEVMNNSKGKSVRRTISKIPPSLLPHHDSPN